MTQNASDVEIANQGFAAFRQDLNDVLEDITTLHSGDTAPTTTYANQWWYETDTDKLYIRNEDNDAWIEILTLDQANDHLATLGASITLDGTGNVSIDSGDFTVDTDTLHVDSTNNRVGIGTSSPDSNLHLTDSSASTDTHVYTKLHIEDGDHSAIQFSGSTGAEQWIWFADTTGAPAGGITYYHGGPYMGFRVEGSERMRIDSSGNVLVGTTSAISTESFTFYSSGSIGVAIRNPASGAVRYPMIFVNGSTTVGSITSSSSSTSFNTSSDYRLKENVTDITDGIERVKQLNPSRFNFIADADTTVDGFLAHEAQAVVPEAVTGTHNEVETWTQDEIDAGDAPANVSAGDNKLDDDGNAIPVYQGIDQSKLVPLLTAALQEAIAKIETLETQATDFETRIAALESA